MKTQLLLTILSLLLTSLVYSQEKKAIPVHVPPMYKSNPLTINTPDYQTELSSLTKDNAAALTQIFQIRMDSISIESLIIFSIRLYDLGMKDESVYWFHTARMRLEIFIKALDYEKMGGIDPKPLELKQAYLSFYDQAGEYINGYAGGNIDQWIDILNRVTESAQQLNGFVQYPDISFVSGEDFQKAKENRFEAQDKLINYFRENKDEIMKTRKKNGTEGKY